ncbi:MAG: ribonuclease activity regulator RraA, partial [Sulfitobacter sp.]|nr:ribonuclease activity regulator RraA [Sulfitobacter sp.]
LEEVLGGAPIIGLYPCTKDENMQKFEAWRKKNGR